MDATDQRNLILGGWQPTKTTLLNLHDENERLKADLQIAKDALFEIYIRPLSPDNADTAGRALEALAD